MIYQILFLTCFFEIATILGRIIWGSKQEKFKKKKSKYKVRIHHGYTGLLLIFLGFILVNEPIITVLGWAFFLSDAMHHFIVLPLWVKKTEFP